MMFQQIRASQADRMKMLKDTVDDYIKAHTDTYTHLFVQGYELKQRHTHTGGNSKYNEVYTTGRH